MHRALLFIPIAMLLYGGVVDRIAITVGRQVITELQLDEEMRVTAFLNHQPVTRDAPARRSAADRLVQQLLVKREMELSRYPLPDADDVNRYVEQVRSQLSDSASFDQALASYNLSENTLREHLALQLMMLRFIEFRFRPDAGGSKADMGARTDDILNDWLEESRKQVHIVYLDKSLQ